MTPPIMVWRYNEAPEEYRNIASHGGDEDWLAFVPDGMTAEVIGWMEEGTPFGSCTVSQHVVKGGAVRVGSHA